MNPKKELLWGLWVARTSDFADFCLVLSREWGNGLLGLLQGILRDHVGFRVVS